MVYILSLLLYHTLWGSLPAIWLCIMIWGLANTQQAIGNYPVTSNKGMLGSLENPLGAGAQETLWGLNRYPWISTGAKDKRNHFQKTGHSNYTSVNHDPQVRGSRLKWSSKDCVWILLVFTLESQRTLCLPSADSPNEPRKQIRLTS